MAPVKRITLNLVFRTESADMKPIVLLCYRMQWRKLTLVIYLCV